MGDMDGGQSATATAAAAQERQRQRALIRSRTLPGRPRERNLAAVAAPPQLAQVKETQQQQEDLPSLRVGGLLRRTRTLPPRAAAATISATNSNNSNSNSGSPPSAISRALSFRRGRPLAQYATVPYPAPATPISPLAATCSDTGDDDDDDDDDDDGNNDDTTADNDVVATTAAPPKISIAPHLVRRNTAASLHRNATISAPTAATAANTCANVHITAVNYVAAESAVLIKSQPGSPLSSSSLCSSVANTDPEAALAAKIDADAFSVRTAAMPAASRFRRNIRDSFKLRAFSRKAISFQRRQWCTNICCIGLCPLIMILVSFVLKTIITLLTNSDASAFQILYCSDQLSINQQNWPIFNLSSAGIAVTSPSSIPHADQTLPVRHANFQSRSSLIDLSSRDIFSQLSSTTIAGSVPCVNWFGSQYFYNDKSIYERVPREQINNYSTRSSVYATEPNSGWLDILSPLAGGDFVSPLSLQAISVARSFAIFQTQPWALFALAPGVDPVLVGSAPKHPVFTDTNAIPLYPFKPASTASGMLDTIEPRVAVHVQVSPTFAFRGFQQVPYFEPASSSSQVDMDAFFQHALRDATTRLAQINSFFLTGGSLTDFQSIDLLSEINNATSGVPYAGILFNRLDTVTQTYQYTLQIGRDKRLDIAPGFPSQGFRLLIQQSQLSNAILRFSNTTLQNTAITQGIRSFPNLGKSTLDIPFGSMIGRVLYPLGISFLLPVYTISLVRDKELRIVTMLRMNGLGHPFTYYLAEYMTFYVNYAVSTLIFWGSGALTDLELFTRTDPFLLFVLFFLWGHAQIVLAMLFNTLYSHSRFALIGTFLVVIGSVVASFIFDQVFPLGGQYPIMLFAWPPFAFYRSIGVLNNAATSSFTVPYTFAMAIRSGDEVFVAMVSLMCGVFVYMGLAVYLACVVPSESGSGLPWYFPIVWVGKAIGIGASKQELREQSQSQSSVSVDVDASYEDDDVRDERVRVGQQKYEPTAPLVIRDMVKEYAVSGSSDKRRAVSHISLAVEMGTVFGLLGPNGAGKTSLIGMLTGVYRPTSGGATLGGYDLVTDPDAAFRSIGVCPQFDILWPDLTVDEHLIFYARLKGVSHQFEREAVVAAMELVKLETLRHRRVKTLSGGEKRRLSIAIALVADPSVVLLDEPTTGLDPEVRRSVWDVIARARGHRVIFMTTHSMEEAEVCCQRIGIMAKGTMRCLGTPAHLKHVYGNGYKLYVHGNSHRLDEADRFILQHVIPQDDCGDLATHTDPSSPTTTISSSTSSLSPPASPKHVSATGLCRARRTQAFNSTRTYIFRPHPHELAHIFDRMSKHSHQHGIQNWGVSQTTLDEIFSAVVAEDDA